MKTGTENKLKFKQLQQRLGLALWQARGLLDTLWNFVGLNCPQGDIGRFSYEEIAIGIDWRDEPDKLLKTLVGVRWIDEDARHGLVVHDWWEHCEDSVHKAVARRIELFASGHMPNMSRFTRDERAQLLLKYEDRYGEKVVKSGGAFENAQERPQTPENAPALPVPSLTIPSLTKPEGCVVAGEPPATPASAGITDIKDSNECDPSQVAFPEFPCVPGKSRGSATWLLTEAQLAEWASTFPAVDVAAECRKAQAWVKANLDRRKTVKGMPGFLFRWLSREQDRGRGTNGKLASPRTEPTVGEFAPRRRSP